MNPKRAAAKAIVQGFVLEDKERRWHLLDTRASNYRKKADEIDSARDALKESIGKTKQGIDDLLLAAGDES